MGAYTEGIGEVMDSIQNEITDITELDYAIITG